MSERMLVGNFTAAQQTIRAAVKQVVGGRIIPTRPRVLIQPLELLEGGLSQIEERALYELGIGAGGSRVVVWIGRELTDDEVRQKLNGK